MLPYRNARHTCNYVLRYEDGLKEQFATLVRLLGSPPELVNVSTRLSSAAKVMPFESESCTGLEVGDLDAESRTLLAGYFRHDFQLFGYSEHNATQVCAKHCADVQPPSNWANPTCETQLANTDRCARRRAGRINDGYCHLTCGVCSLCPTSSLPSLRQRAPTRPDDKSGPRELGRPLVLSNS